MDINKIQDIYNEMSIGTQDERNKYISMSENMNNIEKNVYYFIQNSPISSNNDTENNMEINNAELA
ncbi:MAG: hypothetical protein AB2L13_10885 [Spirochaetota bacterium]